jgi:beta-mannosidase
MYTFPLICHAQESSGARHRLPVESSWEFQQSNAGSKQWLPARVPGDVHLDLLRNHVIPDPYYRDNETKLQWIEDASWTYRTTMTVPAELLHRQHLDLVFDGLDTAAEVFLNGASVLTADNMFRQWRIDAKPYLHEGSNELRVEFRPTSKVTEVLSAGDKMDEAAHIPQKAFLRKAAYEAGWDWGPRFVTSGIWRPVYLDSWDHIRIEDVHVSEPDVSASVAHLVVSVTVQADVDAQAALQLTYGIGAPTETISRSVHLHPGENTVSVPVDVDHPSLWFPAGYGGQTLYAFHARIATGANDQDEKSIRTGLRSVTLQRNRDQWGRSFGFVVNGIPIFAKGAAVIPFDSFPNRVTEADYRHILQSAKDANMNMIRLWGGGYYESETFYDLCDELGLMVWQDFMFASSWYPGGHDFKENVREEADYQVKRLRNHPSMTLWSGNNEVESVLYAFLGGLSADARLQVWKNYLTVFSGILPDIVQRDTAEVPYWPSSPSAEYEDTSDQFQSGDAHDWSIWHGREPFANYANHYYRFTSEYGFQSFPELRTVESFTTPEDRASIFTPVMLAHQKNNEGNAIIHEYLLRDYAEPKDFPSFLYVSQVLQAEGVKAGAEHMRRNRPRIGGSLFWQLNDCWPVASWSSIDYFGRWKALQYYARHFYNPILVSPVLKDGSVEVYVISDGVQPTAASLHVRLLTMEGRILREETRQVTLPPLSSAQYLQWPMQTLVDGQVDLSNVFVAADLSVQGKEISSNLLYLLPTKQVHLLPASIASDLTKTVDGYRLTLKSSVLARDVYVTFGSLEPKLSDNYFDLLPGQPAEITMRGGGELPELRKNLKVVSLVDAFHSATSIVSAAK